jgi:WD40 repeat protein
MPYLMAFSPDGSRLAVAEDDGRVVLWNTATGTSAFTVRACPQSPPGVLASPDGMRILTFCPQECCARLWNATDGTLVKTLQLPRVRNVGWSPDGQWLAVQVKPSLRTKADLYEVPTAVLNLATEEQVVSFRSKLDSGMFTPEGQLIATCAVRKSCMWEIPSGRMSRLFPGVEGPYAICCGGHKVLWSEWVYVRYLGFRELRLRTHVLDLDTGLNAELHIHEDVTPLAVAEDHIAFRRGFGKRVSILIYSIAQQKFVQELSGEAEGKLVAAFSPDGKVLAVMGRSTIKIWRCC